MLEHEIQNDHPAMPKNEDCGLFIGVDDYRTYEKSVGEKPGTSSLPGSVNDAKAFWRVAGWMGMRPENLRILTSPKIDPAELPGATAANVGEATEAGIEAGVIWLAAMLVGRPQRAGLATYSGHGAYLDDKGLLLCPSDTEGEDLKHAIPLSRLATLIGPSGGNLTTVLDCCHSGSASKAPAGAGERRILSLGSKVVPASLSDEALRVSGRVLAACEPQQLSQQSRFMGRWHGAFSWALTSAMGQWKSVPDGAGRRLDTTYGALSNQAATLLGTLSFTCTPVVKGPGNVRDLAVMQRGDTPAETAEDPNATRFHVQLDPGTGTYRWYTIRSGTSVSGSVVGNVLVVGNTSGRINGTGPTYHSNTEYWYNVVSSAPTGTISFWWQDYSTWSSSGPALGSYCFQMPRNPSGYYQSTPRKNSTTFVSNSNNVALDWEVSQNSDRRWIGHFYWYTQTSTGAANNNVFASPTTSGQALTSWTSPYTRSGMTWWGEDLQPNNTAPT